MQEGRKVRLESLIKEELVYLVSRELKDPRVKPITITHVEMSPDGSNASVYFTLFGRLDGDLSGSEDGPSPEYVKDFRDCADGLNSAAPFLRKNLAKVLSIKHVPTLVFKQDKGFVNALKVEELLRKIKDEAH